MQSDEVCGGQYGVTRLKPLVGAVVILGLIQQIGFQFGTHALEGHWHFCDSGIIPWTDTGVFIDFCISYG